MTGWFGEWAERADPAEAFFDGYGRSPSASDMEQLYVAAVLSCISTPPSLVHFLCWRQSHLLHLRRWCVVAECKGREGDRLGRRRRPRELTDRGILSRFLGADLPASCANARQTNGASTDGDCRHSVTLGLSDSRPTPHAAPLSSTY